MNLQNSFYIHHTYNTKYYRSEVVPELDEDGDPIPPPPFHLWVKTYGYDIDDDYRLKRNRRMVEKSFKRLLTKKYSRIRSLKFGPVFVDKFPTEVSAVEKSSK